ncbi:MAG: energy-coupled thiamine transporter ThiT, partial [Clostridia bacterium]|nr:energy-coupled thiamine transporter ThiT [Clostridia bacterium]
MYLFSLLSAASVLETVTPVCKWLTVSLLVTTVLLGALLFFVKRSAFLPFVRFALFGVVLYLIALAILFFALDIGKNYGEANGSLVKLLLAPVLCLACVCFLSLIAIAVVKKRCPNKQKTVYYVCGTLFFTALAVCFVCLTVYYNQNIKNDGYYNSDTASVKQLALYIGAILCVGVVVALAFTDKRKIDFDSRSVAYAGICSAMSFALSYIKLWDMPQGGSVTLVSLLPVMLYGYIFGAKKGVFVGLCYGLLQAVQDPWIIHPAQMLLDYPVAFSAVGLAG